MTDPSDQPAPDLEARWRVAEAELYASRQQIADLSRELEETNRGLIAFHHELEVARQAEAQLAAIVRSSEDAMVSMTPELVITGWNPGAEHLFGFTAAEVIGKNTPVIPAELRDEFDQIRQRVSVGNASTYDTKRLRKDGTLVDVSVTLSVMRGPGGEPIGYSAVARDITRRLAAEDELAAARAQSEVLAERERMARELHDRVIGRVFAAGMTLQGIAGLAGQADVAARIAGVVGELDTAIDEVRQAIFALSPRAERAQASLRAQVLSLTTETSALGFTPSVTFEGAVDTVAADVRADLLAVIREALINTARHAQATAAQVILTIGADVVLVVSDNGRGMNQASPRGGLRRINDRAFARGGSFRVSSPPGGGTRLEWRIPADPLNGPEWRRGA